MLNMFWKKILQFRKRINCTSRFTMYIFSMMIPSKVFLRGVGVWIQNCLRTDIFVKITRNEWKKLNAISSTQYKCTITILFSEYHLTVICLQYLSKIIIFFCYFFVLFYVINDKNMFLKQLLAVLNCVHNKETGIPIVQL